MWLRKGRRYVFMDQAGDGSGGGAGSGAAGDAGGSGAAAGAGTAAQATSGISDGGGAASSAGSSGGGSGDAGSALAQAGQQTVTIPEKYQVKKDDGSLDIEASSLKLAEAYGHLEKRLGSGDAPPKTADEYQITPPEALKDWDAKADPLMQGFLQKLHGKGASQAVLDVVMEQYFQIAPELVGGAKQLSAEECVADLRAEWKTDEQYKAEIGKAFNAATAYAGNDAQYIIDTYGNDPKVIRMLNRIGGELGEDHSTGTQGSTQSAESVQALMSSEAYSNPKHPDHAKVSRQVADHFQKQAAAAEKAGAAPLL